MKDGAGLDTKAALGAMVFVWLLGVFDGVLSGRLLVVGVPGAAAFALALVAVLSLTTPREGPLSRQAAVSVVLGCVGTAVLVLVQLDRAQDIWLFDFVGYLVALLLPRGNPRAGTLGLTLLASWALTWGVVTSQTTKGMVELLTRLVLASVVGIAWMLVLRHIVRRERQAHSATELASVRAVAAEAAAAAREAELAEIAVTAEPLLRDLAAGRAVDESFRRSLVVVEGEIRDRIQAADLRDPELATAIAAARWNGTRVVMIGAEIADRATSRMPVGAITEIMTDTSLDAVSVRSLPPERGAAVSVMTERNGHLQHMLLDYNGSPIPVAQSHDPAGNADGLNSPQGPQ
ncbi:MAG: hypothetical protein QM628_03505 [Propionicimonas sp.]